MIIIEGDRNDDSIENMKATVLYELCHRQKWGGAHLPLERFLSYFPRSDKNLAEHAIKKLRLEGLLIIKPTNYSDGEVSLNPRKKREITEKISLELGIMIMVLP